MLSSFLSREYVQAHSFFYHFKYSSNGTFYIRIRRGRKIDENGNWPKSITMRLCKPRSQCSLKIQYNTTTKQSVIQFTENEKGIEWKKKCFQTITLRSIQNNPFPNKFHYAEISAPIFFTNHFNLSTYLACIVNCGYKLLRIAFKKKTGKT